jgi:hypothetical protein
MPTAMLLAEVIALYGLAGLITATAFVIFGVTRVLADPMPVSAGARILLLPGAALLWPYVLWRWSRSGGPR